MKLTSQFPQILIDNWNRESHPLGRNEFGVWSIRLESQQGQYPISHGSRVKVAHVCLNADV